jgi:hypothetical protein
MGLVVLVLAVSAVAAEDEVKVEVTGNRVSLRAAPELNSVFLDRAMKGDSLVLADDSNAEWLGVFPPESVDLWVHSEFIRDNKVVPEQLNIRSGPSLNHSVVGVVERAQELTIRGEVAGWLRIAPPKGSVAWISRQYAEIVGAAKEPVISITVEPAPEPETVQVVKTVSQPEINVVMTATAGLSGLPEALEPDPAKNQGSQITLSGILRPAGGLLYKLVNPDIEGTTVCYVRGNAEQTKELEGQALTIMGRSYWALDLDLPFIRPLKIQMAK